MTCYNGNNQAGKKKNMVREAKAPSRPVCWSLFAWCLVMLLESFYRSQKTKQSTDLAWIFGQFQEPTKAKNKLREHKSEKPLSFQPNILSKLLLFYIYEVLAKTEKWLICEAMQLGPNIF